MLDCCDLVVCVFVLFFVCVFVCVCVCVCVCVWVWVCVCVCVCVCFLFFFSTLCLQVGNHFGFWGGFSCFVSFIWCQLFACLIRAVIVCLPPAFVVWTFFLCHGHLSSVLSFFATGICVQSLSFTAFSVVGIRVRLFVSALLALVSGYQGISQFFFLFCFFVSCCAIAAPQLHPWRFEPDFVLSRLPFGQLYKFRFEVNPIWYSAIKFTKSHSTKCSLHRWAWLRHSIKVSSLELYRFDPCSPQSGSIPRERVHPLCFGLLVSCYSLLQHSRPAWLELFVDNKHTRIHIQWTI